MTYTYLLINCVNNSTNFLNVSRTYVAALLLEHGALSCHLARIARTHCIDAMRAVATQYTCITWSVCVSVFLSVCVGHDLEPEKTAKPIETGRAV